jgi:hypothetical protein
MYSEISVTLYDTSLVSACLHRGDIELQRPCVLHDPLRDGLPLLLKAVRVTSRRAELRSPFLTASCHFQSSPLLSLPRLSTIRGGIRPCGDLVDHLALIGVLVAARTLRLERKAGELLERCDLLTPSPARSGFRGSRPSRPTAPTRRWRGQGLRRRPETSASASRCGRRDFLMTTPLGMRAPGRRGLPATISFLDAARERHSPFSHRLTVRRSPEIPREKRALLLSPRDQHFGLSPRECALARLAAAELVGWAAVEPLLLGGMSDTRADGRRQRPPPGKRSAWKSNHLSADAPAPDHVAAECGRVRNALPTVSRGIPPSRAAPTFDLSDQVPPQLPRGLLQQRRDDDLVEVPIANRILN